MIYFRAMFKDDFTLTKRQLGLLMVAASTAALVIILGLDVVLPGHEGGIGPAQRLALVLCIIGIVLGATLIPLGNDPA